MSRLSSSHPPSGNHILHNVLFYTPTKGGEVLFSRYDQCILRGIPKICPTQMTS